MKPFPLPSFTALLLLLALGACSTPEAALQQANHTSGLMASLERELIAFRRVRSVAEQSQQESIHAQEAALATARLLSGARIRARKSAGDTATQKLADRLVADAEALAADEAALAGAPASNDAAVARMMTPLPSTSSAITLAQSKIAPMGQELPAPTRAGELRSFAQAVRDDVQANRKKIEEAQASAAAKR